METDGKSPRTAIRLSNKQSCCSKLRSIKMPLAGFWISSAARKAGKYSSDLVSPFRRNKRSACIYCPRQRTKIDSQNRYGLINSLRPPCGLRIFNFVVDRHAARVLAGVLELARQIFAGSHRGAATGVAAYCSWILCLDRTGPAWPDWKIV